MPSIDGSPLRFGAVLVLLVVGTAGLVGYAPANATGTDGPPLGSDAAEQFADLDAVSGTVVTEVSRANETSRSVHRVALRPGTGDLRSEAVSGDTRGADLRVSNGVTTWVYEDETNTARELPAGSFEARASRGDRIERLFEQLQVSQAAANGTTVTGAPGIDPLPVVPHGDGPDVAATTRQADEYRLRYEGTDTVAGHEVYVVSVATTGAASDDGPSNYTQTLYVDTEHFYPLRTHTGWTVDGERVTTTVTYRDVTFGTDLDDDVFTFEPPADATVERTGLDATDSYDSVAAASGRTTLSVPDVDLPATFELDTARVATAEPSAVQLQYSNATALVVVTKHTGDALYAGEGQHVVVDDHAATYHRFGDTHVLTWECGGTQYAVSGTGVPRATVTAVASSVDCG